MARRSPLFLFLMLIATSASCLAQRVVPIPDGNLKAKPVPETKFSVPFSLDAAPSQQMKSIEHRAESQMSDDDRRLVASDGPMIEKSAALAGIEYDGSGWKYSQIVCPVLPTHLLLLFTSEEAAHGASMFSAAIPRGGNGPVRVVPILRHAFTTYSPAAVNRLTMSVFNRIRSQEQPGQNPDWLTTGLCYAALAGAEPSDSPPSEHDANGMDAAGTTPVLEISGNGGATVRLEAITATHRAMNWALTFDASGKLVDVVLSPTSQITAKPVR